MTLTFNMLFFVLSVFAVVGLVQWVKSFAPNIISGWRIPLASLVLSFGIAFIAGGSINQIVINALIILAMVELAWSLIVKTVLNLIANIGGISSGIDAGSAKVLDTLSKVLPKEQTTDEGKPTVT